MKYQTYFYIVILLLTANQVNACTDNSGCSGTTPYCNTGASPVACETCAPGGTPDNSKCTSPATCQGDGSCLAPACSSNTDCSGTTPYCNTGASPVACETCAPGGTPDNSKCTSPATCQGDGSCQAPTTCTAITDCSGTTPFCNTAAPGGAVCQSCANDSSNAVCVSPKKCFQDGSCGTPLTDCSTNTDCSGTTPYCHTDVNGSKTCEACGDDVTHSVCQAPNSVCKNDGSCGAPASCTDNASCTEDSTPYCNTAATGGAVCESCSGDPTVCTAPEQCLADGSCGACSVNTDCSGTKPFCNTAATGGAACQSCANDSTNAVCSGSNPTCNTDGSCGPAPASEEEEEGDDGEDDDGEDDDGEDDGGSDSSNAHVLASVAAFLLMILTV